MSCLLRQRVSITTFQNAASSSEGFDNLGKGEKAIKLGSVILNLGDWNSRANIKHGDDEEEKYLLSFQFRCGWFNTVICLDRQ